MKVDKVFIVKVQVPLMSNSADAMKRCLVYNEDRSFKDYFPIDKNIKRAMKGRPKAFFRAGMMGDTFVLGTESEVPDPGW